MMFRYLPRKFLRVVISFSGLGAYDLRRACGGPIREVMCVISTFRWICFSLIHRLKLSLDSKLSLVSVFTTKRWHKWDRPVCFMTTRNSSGLNYRKLCALSNDQAVGIVLIDWQRSLWYFCETCLHIVHCSTDWIVDEKRKTNNMFCQVFGVALTWWTLRV